MKQSQVYLIITSIFIAAFLIKIERIGLFLLGGICLFCVAALIMQLFFELTGVRPDQDDEIDQPW